MLGIACRKHLSPIKPHDIEFMRKATKVEMPFLLQAPQVLRKALAKHSTAQRLVEKRADYNVGAFNDAIHRTYSVKF